MRILNKNNVYVLGTGRCGTTSLAEKLGGLHEPEPNIIHESTQFYLGKQDIQARLIDKLIERKKLKATAIVDHKQSMVIPLLRYIDPAAEFILLVREPLACIESLYARGAYSKEEQKKRKAIWVKNRLRPYTDFPKDWTAFMKCTWYWLETHRVIFSTIGNAKFSILLTDEIGTDVTQNKSEASYKDRLRKKQNKGLTKQEESLLDNYALPMWEQIQAYSTRK